MDSLVAMKAKAGKKESVECLKSMERKGPRLRIETVVGFGTCCNDTIEIVLPGVLSEKKDSVFSSSYLKIYDL